MGNRTQEIKNEEYWVNQSKSFDKSAEYYDQFRPSYPAELINELISRTGVDGDSKILEVGAGSGKATELFVDRGLKIICIEPGANLAEMGRRRFESTGQVDYIVSRFEEWQETPEAYDLVISAQAFHWVPKPLGYQKAYNTLKPQKYMGLFWNLYVSSGEAVEEELKELYKEYPLAYLLTKEGLENRIQQIVAEIKGSGYFKKVDVLRYPWTEECNIEEYIGFLKTGNEYLTLKEEERKSVEEKVEEIINRHGGKIKRCYAATLFLAQRD